MIQISPSVSASKPSSARPALLASGGTQAFALALKTALAPGATAEAEGETPLLELAVRQKPAADGKALPDSDAGEAEVETGDEAEDIAFAWFGASSVLPQPTPALPHLPVSASAIRLPVGEAPVVMAQPGIASPLAAQAVGLDIPSSPGANTGAVTRDGPKVDVAQPAPATPAPILEMAPPASIEIDAAAPAAVTPASGPASLAPIKLPTPIDIGAAAPVERAAGPIRTEIPPAQVAAVRIQPVTLASIPPRAEAVQPLAAPLVAAAIEAPSPRRAGPREATISALSTPTAEAPRPHAVPATPDAQQPALDMRRHEWMASMVERIEALRDSPTSRETSIRLSPDALGTVDISIRHEGDRVHVRFSAETPAARAALADAQPRLAELAEARGLRLGETSVDGGAGERQRQPAAPGPAFTSAPARVLGSDPATDSDERIA